MINEDMYALGAAPNKIREIFAYGLERKAQIGDDKVFDLSIGNPSVPSPAIGRRDHRPPGQRGRRHHAHVHDVARPRRGA